MKKMLYIAVILLSIALIVMTALNLKARETLRAKNRELLETAQLAAQARDGWNDALESLDEATEGLNMATKTVTLYEALCIELNAENKRLTAELQEAERQTEPVKVPDMVERYVCSIDDFLANNHTNMMFCMGCDKITNKASEQYALMYSGDIYIEENGLMSYSKGDGESYYCVALGGAFGYKIGGAWHVRLKCGEEFNVVQADFKSPIPTTREEKQKAATDFGKPCKNYDGQDCHNVIEFIVDMDVLDKRIKSSGTVSAIFGGLMGDGADIVEMTYLGRVWEP